MDGIRAIHLFVFVEHNFPVEFIFRTMPSLQDDGGTRGVVLFQFTFPVPFEHFLFLWFSGALAELHTVRGFVLFWVKN